MLVVHVFAVHVFAGATTLTDRKRWL